MSGTLTITVSAVNDAPVAVDDAVTATEDTVFNSAIDLDANDTDIDGDALEQSLPVRSPPPRVAALPSPQTAVTPTPRRPTSTASTRWITPLPTVRLD